MKISAKCCFDRLEIRELKSLMKSIAQNSLGFDSQLWILRPKKDTQAL